MDKMNARIPTVLAFLFLTFSQLEGQTGTFIVEGHIRNLPDSTRIILFKNFGDVSMSIGEDTIINGRFRFEATGDSIPSLHHLSLKGKNIPKTGSCYLWLANNTITRVTGDSTLVQTWDVENNILEQQELNAYTKASKDILSQWNLIRTQKHLLESRKDKKLQPTIDSLQSILDSLSLLENLSNLKVMAQRPVSEMMIKKLNDITSYSIHKHPEIFALALEQYHRLSDVQKQSLYGKSITDHFSPPKELNIGDQMADYPLHDQNGNTYKLSDFKGTYLLLDFWSVGCGPCVMAGPEMKEITEKYAESVTIIGINLDSPQGWKLYWGEEITWKNLNGGTGLKTGIAVNYGVRALPLYVLIDPNGVIVDKWSGYGKGSLVWHLKKNNVIVK